ncbi:amino acid ABC transporter permease [Actinomycetota bacterium]
MGDLLTRYDILGAFLMTIKISLAAGLLALVLGTLLAIFRLSPIPVLRAFGSTYVNLVRNTPLTLLVTFAQFGLLSLLNWHLANQSSPTSVADDNFRWGVLALGGYTAAFVCEALRSGVNTIPVGQAEAARSIGLTFTQTLREVVLPQAFRASIAPLGSTFIAMIKNSTVLSVIGVAEIAFLQSRIIDENADQLYTIMAIVALGFVILTLPLGMGATALSKKLAVKR